MNLDLQAADLVKVGSISGKDVLQMLPISKVKGKVSLRSVMQLEIDF